MAKVSTNISIDADVKKQAQALFADLGLDLSTAINIYLKKAVDWHGIPFDVTRSEPNPDTIAAMGEFDEMKEHPEKYKRYSSFDDALKEVLDA